MGFSFVLEYFLILICTLYIYKIIKNRSFKFSKFQFWFYLIKHNSLSLVWTKHVRYNTNKNITPSFPNKKKMFLFLLLLLSIPTIHAVDCIVGPTVNLHIATSGEVSLNNLVVCCMYIKLTFSYCLHCINILLFESFSNFIFSPFSSTSYIY